MLRTANALVRRGQSARRQFRPRDEAVGRRCGAHAPCPGAWAEPHQVKTPAGGRRVDTVMLSGNGGQKVFIVPSLDLIAVFTGGAFNTDSPVNVMMAQALLPALLNEQAPGR